MAKCRNCGREIPDNSNICPYCKSIYPISNNSNTGQVPLDKMSGMAIAGFVCSFFVPFIGLPFSITAYDRSKRDNYKTNQYYAIAGITISIIMLFAWAIVILVLLFI